MPFNSIPSYPIQSCIFVYLNPHNNPNLENDINNLKINNPNQVSHVIRFNAYLINIF